MNKVNIALSKYNSSGTIACLEGDGDEVKLVIFRNTERPKMVCKLAAARLRMLAKRFDKLAEMEDPFKCDVQEEINT
jgi:hypothetical protein